MNTEQMLEMLDSVEFVSRQDAANLASVALKEYGRYTKEAKQVERLAFDMSMAGGCPNAVYNAVYALFTRYKKAA